MNIHGTVAQSENHQTVLSLTTLMMPFFWHLLLYFVINTWFLVNSNYINVKFSA